MSPNASNARRGQCERELLEGSLASVFDLKRHLKPGRLRNVWTAIPRSDAAVAELNLPGTCNTEVALLVEKAIGSDDVDTTLVHTRSPGSFDGKLETAAHEAQALKHLSGNGVPQLYFHAISDRRSVAVMELLHGESLSNLLKRRTLSEKEARSLTRSALRSLQRIHSCGFVHACIGTRHIVLSTPNDISSAVFVDLRQSHYLSLPATESQLFKGSFSLPHVQFPPPEQFRGFASLASDIYALGATLYTTTLCIEPFEPTLSAPASETECQRTYESTSSEPPSSKSTIPVYSASLAKIHHSKFLQLESERSSKLRAAQSPPSFPRAGISRTAADLLQAMMDADSSSRPLVGEALRHPWVASLDGIDKIQQQQRTVNLCMHLPLRLLGGDSYGAGQRRRRHGRRGSHSSSVLQA